MKSTHNLETSTIAYWKILPGENPPEQGGGGGITQACDIICQLRLGRVVDTEIFKEWEHSKALLTTPKDFEILLPIGRWGIRALPGAAT